MSVPNVPILLRPGRLGRKRFRDISISRDKMDVDEKFGGATRARPPRRPSSASASASTNQVSPPVKV
ncbi:hypothetical protein NL676_004101 [Syzygium grande]|nr:hypothetical protein NL676_004101 [Syzygium grande]